MFLCVRGKMLNYKGKRNVSFIGAKKRIEGKKNDMYANNNRGSEAVLM